MPALPAATRTAPTRSYASGDDHAGPLGTDGAEHAAIAAALQVFETGLRDMRIGPQPVAEQGDGAEAGDRADLLASIATRANLLALDTAITAARGGAAGAAAAIRDHVDTTAALTEALARHIAGLRP